MLRIKMSYPKSAWTGIYLYAGKSSDNSAELRKVAHVVFDPTAELGPRIDFGIGHRILSVKLPFISFQTASKFRLLLPVYRLQHAALWRLDGRYRR